MKEAWATVVSAGGEPVNLGRNRTVILRDVNDFFLQVLESAPAAGKGARREMNELGLMMMPAGVRN